MQKMKKEEEDQKKEGKKEASKQGGREGGKAGRQTGSVYTDMGQSSRSIAKLKKKKSKLEKRM